VGREQETDHALLGAFAAEQQHLVLRRGHFVAQDHKELRPQLGRFIDQGEEAIAREAPNLHVGHGFGPRSSPDAYRAHDPRTRRPT
jgi:hypothetical protein